MKRQIKSSIDESEYPLILMEANEAKDRLYQVAHKLDEIGKHHQAESCMILIYMIEEWQNRRNFRPLNVHQNNLLYR